MSDLPRLLLCSFDVVPGPTGPSRRLTEYLRGLADHFHVVALTVKTPDHAHIEKVHGARLLRVPVGAGDLVARVQAFDRAVRRQIDSEEYALVHFTDPFGGYGLCEARDSHGYKLVYDAQTFPSQELRFTHPQLEGDRRFLARVRRQELFCLMNADRVITGSKVTRSFIHSLGVSQELVSVVRQPLDLPVYDAEPYAPPTRTPMRLCYLGSQVGWQGVPTLLRGLAHARRKVDVQLSIVGAGHPAWQPLLEDLIAELDLRPHVELRPPVPHAELPRLLSGFDVGVVPLDDLGRNRVQGGPLAKAAEYLAAGRPIIASDLPLTRELLPHSATRFHAPGDPEDVADLLVELAEDPELRARLGMAAREEARRLHDGELIRGQLHQLYRQVTGLNVGSAPQMAADAPSGVGTPTRRVDNGLVRSEVSDQPGTDPEVRAEALAERSPRPRLSVRHSSHTEGARRRSQREDDSDPAYAPPTMPGIPLVAEVPEPPAATPPPLPSPPTVEVSEAAFSEEEEVSEAAIEPIEEADEPDEIEAAEPIEEELEPVLEAPEPLPADVAIPEVEPAELELADDAVLEPSEENFEGGLDPWLAQLIHGWCPPEGAQFARPTPPTNFPGRDGPPPPTVASLPRPGGEG